MATSNRRAFLTQFVLLGGGTLLAACTPAPGTGAPPPKPQGSPPGGTTTVVYAVSSNPATLNPLLDDGGASQTGYELMFEALVKPDPKTGTPSPSICCRHRRTSTPTSSTRLARSGLDHSCSRSGSGPTT